MKRESFPSSDAAVGAHAIHLLRSRFACSSAWPSASRFISRHDVLDRTMHGANLPCGIKQPTAWATVEGGTLGKMRVHRAETVFDVNPH